MKKFSFIALAALAMLASCSNDDEPIILPSTDVVPEYTLRTLTFEDASYQGGVNYAGGYNWSTLIDTPEYGGKLLYGASYNAADGWDAITDSSYVWYDADNTKLISNVISGAYWNGGIAISNCYKATASSAADNATSDNQLSISNGSAGAAGYSNSANFAVANGNATLTFNDMIARVIDHMYICATTYTIDEAINGSNPNGWGSFEAFDETDWASVYVTGYDLTGKEVGKLEFKLIDGTNAVSTWTKWDLSSLGAVASLKFTFDSSDHSVYGDTDYGTNIPSYVAIDNVAVRFQIL